MFITQENLTYTTVLEENFHSSLINLGTLFPHRSLRIVIETKLFLLIRKTCSPPSRGRKETYVRTWHRNQGSTFSVVVLFYISPIQLGGPPPVASGSNSSSSHFTRTQFKENFCIFQQPFHFPGSSSFVPPCASRITILQDIIRCANQGTHQATNRVSWIGLWLQNNAPTILAKDREKSHPAKRLEKRVSFGCAHVCLVVDRIVFMRVGLFHHGTTLKDESQS